MLIGRRMRQQHQPETRWAIETLQLRPTDQVLEVGFGIGDSLRTLLTHIHQGHLVGIDRSMTMVRAATRRNQHALNHRRLTLLCGDLAHLPLAPQQFDKILSIHTFYFWPDRYQTSLRLLQCLKPQGRLIASFATATRDDIGKYHYQPLQNQAEAVVSQLQHHPELTVQLALGPDSRQFNNVALIIDRS